MYKNVTIKGYVIKNSEIILWYQLYRKTVRGMRYEYLEKESDLSKNS